MPCTNIKFLKIGTNIIAWISKQAKTNRKISHKIQYMAFKIHIISLEKLDKSKSPITKFLEYYLWLSRRIYGILSR